MIKNWLFNKDDEEFAEEARKLVPDRVVDIHAHLYRIKDLGTVSSGLFSQGPEEAGAEIHKGSLSRMLGKRPEKALYIPMPTYGCDVSSANSFLVSELEKNPDDRGLVLTDAKARKDEVLSLFDMKQIAGFKPYHVFSTQKPTFDSVIGDFVPEWVFEAADKKGCIVMLHIVREEALSDSENQKTIREKCLKYPGMKLVLAHAGRGFSSYNTVNGIGSLKGIGNIWFDTSGICEPEALKAVLYEFGPEKLLWGSDFPISQQRGKCVSAGRGFVWLQDDTVMWDRLAMKRGPVLIGLENIAALGAAAKDFGLSVKDIEDIFGGNADRLLGFEGIRTDITQELYRHAKEIIPGGGQLLSKRPEMFAPGQWPAYFSRAQGCEVWDLDGRHYYDMSTNAVGSCLLGYRDEDVTRAVRRRINSGTMSSLNPPEEVMLADKLIGIHPWAEQVRYARSGGEIAAVAVRLARAATGRSVIAISGYHGWHDWYLALNLGQEDALDGHLLPGLEPLGVPAELRNTAVAFRHGSREEFRKVLETHGDRLAAVIMEPCRHHDPDAGFLDYVREETHKKGALLIFDEITIGWRRNLGGAHLKLGTDPDMAIFAKALGNGHPIAAVIGTREAMAGAHTSFISSTYWTESVGPAAALAAIDKFERYDVTGHIDAVGGKIARAWKKYAERYSLPVKVGDGYNCFAGFVFEHPLSQELKTLYTQLMLKKGFLAGSTVYTTLAHTDEVAALYDKAIEEVFGEISVILENERVVESLEGPVAHTGFRRLI